MEIGSVTSALGEFATFSIIDGYGWILWLLYTIIFACTLYSLYGGLVPQSQVFGPIVKSCPNRGPVLALTFDDGPHPSATRKIMDMLENYEGRGTFFVIGSHAMANPEIVKEIVRRGHLLGNHTHTHPWLMGFALSKRTRTEIEECQETCFNTAGLKPHFYRQPIGFKNPLLFKQIKRSGLIVVGWKIRALDTFYKNSEKIIQRILRKVSDGAIIAFHDGHDLNNTRKRPATINALSIILPELKKRGYRFVTVADLLCEAPYQNTVFLRQSDLCLNKPVPASQQPVYKG